MRNSGTAFTWDFLREMDRPRLIIMDNSLGKIVERSQKERWCAHEP